MSELDKLLEGVASTGSATEKVEWKTLGEVAKIQRGKRLVKNELEESGKYAVFQNSMTPLGYYHESNVQSDTTFIISAGAAGEIGYSGVDFWAADDVYYFVTPENLKSKYLYYYLLTQQTKISGQVRRASVPRLSKSAFEKMQIPIPPRSVQKEIVRILDTFTELAAELAARRKQYSYYREQLLSFDEGEVEWKALESLAENLDSMRKPVTSGLRDAGNIPYYGASGVVDYVKDYIFNGDFLLVSEDGANLIARNTPIAFSISGKSWVNNHAHVLKFNTYAERRFVEYYLNSIDLTPYISGAAQPKLNQRNLNSIKIPNPSPEVKVKIVSILDKFDMLTTSMSEGLPKEIELRKKQYEYYREILLTFPNDNIKV